MPKWQSDDSKNKCEFCCSFPIAFLVTVCYNTNQFHPSFVVKEFDVSSFTKLTHLKFYQACELLKKNKEKFLTERPTQAEFANILGDMLKFKVTPSSIRDIQESTGIKWTAKIVRQNGNGGVEKNMARHNAIRTLTQALHKLYSKLGEEIPQTLDELYKQFAH